MGGVQNSQSGPRFPAVPRERGHYESYYVKACHPTEPAAVWIRYTVHKRPGEEPKGSLWSTVFDAATGPPKTAKITLPHPSAEGDAFLSVGESFIRNGSLRGTALDHIWDLRFAPNGPPLLHLPKRWMYRARVPRTKLSSPYPDATFDGTVRVGDKIVTLEAWPGTVGHNWGSQHAERWIWLHASFGNRSWLDVALGRVRLGAWTTPWIANGVLCVEGVRHTLGGLKGIRGTEVQEDISGCRFTLPGSPTVTGQVERSLDQTVVWPYADPDGSLHHSLNCSISSMSLECGGRKLSTHHGAVYELGIRETDHGLEVQPFADG